jgi:sortase A
MLAGGVALLAYVAVIVEAGDPVTGLQARLQQRQLRRQLVAETAPAGGRRRQSAVRAADGAPLGVLRIPRLHLDAVVVQGTSAADLARGPGHYRRSGLPGSGEVVAVAGHRTTYGAWFRHLDELPKGAPIFFAFRGRTFTYRVTGRRIVSPTDWRILDDPGYEELVLSTCNPVYSAAQRLIVFARLDRYAASAAAATGADR